MAHTPGPWECGGEAKIALTFDREANIFPPPAEKTGGYQYGGPVAVVAVSEDAGGLANARLVAAAPDLLAACKRSLALLTFRLDMAEICDDEKLHWSELQRLVAKTEDTEA